LQSGKPDFPFCLCWANETWTGIWHGSPDRILIKQTYPGRDDEERHFYDLLPAFTDPRYMKIDGKVIFLIHRPELLPDPNRLTDNWRNLSIKNGLKGLYLIGATLGSWEPKSHGFDASTAKRAFHSLSQAENKLTRKIRRVARGLLKRPKEVYSYRGIYPQLMMPEACNLNVHPCVIPNWDNTPRAGLNGVVLHGSTPLLFKKHLNYILQQIMHKPFEQRLLFVKSWNEWAEGNHLEPDLRFGRAYLEVLRQEICED
jgi:hypothetical protein